jgi:hypothetical protein
VWHFRAVAIFGFILISPGLERISEICIAAISINQPHVATEGCAQEREIPSDDSVHRPATETRNAYAAGATLV